MNQIISIGRLILFFMSSIGYWEFFRKKGKIHVYFLPGFTVVFQISVLFIAGILNCLIPAYLLLFAVGLILVTYYLVTEKGQFPIRYLNEGFIFLFCAVCLCALALRGKIFVFYDNFSHWALVVKSMLITNRFPNFSDTTIRFQAYPLGSSSYICYFAKIVSTSEPTQMLAQCYMMLCFILPIFKCGEKYRGGAAQKAEGGEIVPFHRAVLPRIFNVVFLAIFTNYIFCYYMQIINLTVDTLLPLEGMAAVFFVFSECIKKDEEGEKVSFLYAIPFLCAAIQIKNSGIFFALLACIAIIAAIFKYKMNWKSGAVACVSPFISLYLWQAHCAYVFPSALTTKHAMTLLHYYGVLAQKTVKDVITIAEKIGAFTVQGRELLCFLALLIIVTVITLIFIRQKRKQLMELWIVCISIYAVYMLGMLFMYMLSMPLGEALSLASSVRYRKTILIALYYIVMWFFMSTLPQIENRKQYWAAALAALLTLVVTWKYERGFASIFRSEGPDDAVERMWIENTADEYGIPPQKSYMICAPSGGRTEYIGYLCQYIFYSSHISSREITEASQLDDAIEYDYILLYDNENEIINDWVAKNYPEQTGQDVIVVGE